MENRFWKAMCEPFTWQAEHFANNSCKHESDPKEIYGNLLELLVQLPSAFNGKYLLTSIPKQEIAQFEKLKPFPWSEGVYSAAESITKRRYRPMSEVMITMLITITRFNSNWLTHREIFCPASLLSFGTFQRMLSVIGCYHESARLQSGINDAI